MQGPEKNTSFVLLFLIVVLAAVLRFYNYSDLSMTGDEISVLHRLRFESFNDLIDHGVRIDGHPAGVQVFMYYWTDLFGTTESYFRLPYVICGILSVFFSFILGAKFFNKNTGLWFAASMCFLQFPLIYSQIGRPYSPGLCFTLMSTWLWYLVLFEPHKRYWLKIVSYGFSVALAVYCHYFSFFQVLIIGASGFLFLNKQNQRGFLISGIIAFALFLPHFGVSLDHLKIGGLREAAWLGPPNQDPNWFFNYLVFCFNNSALVFLVFLSISTSLIVRYGIKSDKNPLRLLCFVWFILPFLVGYIYSVYVNPVLQRSVLLFSFPFLLLLMFSFMPKHYTKTMTTLLLLFLFSGCMHTVFVKKFYKNNFFGVLKEVVMLTDKYNEEYGKHNITKTINVGHPLFVEYYSKRDSLTTEYTPYIVENQEHRYRNNGKEDLRFFVDLVDTAQTDYFLYAWSSKYSPNEITQIIQEKYAYLVKRKYFFNSEVYLFSRYDSVNTINEIPLFYENIDFSELSASLLYPDNFNDEMLKTENGNQYIRLAEKDEFGPCFTKRVGDVMNRKDNIIHVQLKAMFPTALSKAMLVMALEDQEGVQYSWRGMDLTNFVLETNKWQKVFHSWRFNRIISSKDILKIYVWKPGEEELLIDDLQIKVDRGNPIIYGENNYTLK